MGGATRASHAIEEDAPGTGSASDGLDDLDPPPTGSASLDHALNDAARRQREAVDALNARVADSGLSPDGILPYVAAHVFQDALDTDTRTGGVGDWRTRGSGWHLSPDTGVERSATWTITNASSGKYGHLSTTLVTPMIDLSAYPFQPWNYPVIGGDVGYVTGSCDENRPCTNNGRVFSDEINLIIAHRFRFNPRDGGQVVIFRRDPVAFPEDVGFVIDPISGNTNYSKPTVQSLQGSGFTSSSDWQASAFDLTPWGGRQIWLGFRVATHPGAEKNPTHFDVGGTGTFGWDVDNIRILAPAWSTNLKVVSIDADGFRTDARDPFDRLPVGESRTVSAVVLNAAGTTREARATITVSGDGIPEASQNVTRVLAPGEVWEPTLAFKVPNFEGARFNVTVSAENPVSEDDRITQDPTPEDNRITRPFVASNVPWFDVKVTPTPTIVDYNEAVTARVAVVGTGNVPVQVDLRLFETIGDDPSSRIDHGTARVTVAPGATEYVERRVSTSVRGAHHLEVNASSATSQRVSTGVYYVHASPPPAFFEDDGVPDTGWIAERAIPPIPRDAGMWVLREVGRGYLQAFPTAEALAAGEDATFRDLRLEMWTQQEGISDYVFVEIVYTRPVQFAPNGVPVDTRTVVWKTGLPVMRDGRYKEENLSWQRFAVAVDPAPARGYIDLWSTRGLEIDVSASPNENKPFFLDDLRLTGVPSGADESARIDIVRITGDPDQDAISVAPAQPSVCPGEGGGNSFTERPGNCWRMMSRGDALAIATITNWQGGTDSNRLTIGDERATWHYAPSQLGELSERVVTPPFRLSGAIDPTLTFDHTYVFTSFPEDGRQSQVDQMNPYYAISQIGMVVLSYRRDDGEWSPFSRLVPDGGYPEFITTNPAGSIRQPARALHAGDGFYYPPPCTGDSGPCELGGHILNFREDGAKVWLKFPAPRRDVSVFKLTPEAQRLGDVNLTDREIKLAFHATKGGVGAGTQVMRSEWILGPMRVMPISQFAVDAEVASLALDVPYDWRKLGIPPGAIVPLNVTVRNVGRFTESFAVTVDATIIGGDAEPSTYDIGVLNPGETKVVRVPWRVPDVADRSYRVTARIHPSDLDIPDDNFFNDAATIGERGELVTHTVRDVTIRSEPFPRVGRASLARFIPITLVNEGNVPLDGIIVERVIERQSASGRERLDAREWTLSKDLPPGGEAFEVRTLAPEPALRTEDAYFTPGIEGEFIVSTRVTLPRGLVDANPLDNDHRAVFEGRTAIAFDSFDGPLMWEPSDATLWHEGDGFRSRSGLEASNRSSNTLPASTDAWVTSPTIPLASAQRAIVNAFVKYDIEEAYDGGVLEITTDDGATWTRVPPTDARGRIIDYATSIVGSNPIASEGARAFSGDSRSLANNLDGWVPVSFDLSAMPSLTELVSFSSISAPPKGAEALVKVAPQTYSSPWLTTNASREAHRWEIMNATEEMTAHELSMWWSGRANLDEGLPPKRTLTQTFPLSGVDPNDEIELSWWDARSGTAGSSWKGITGSYHVEITQLDDLRNKVVKASDDDVTLVDSDGRWHRLSVKPTNLDYSRILTVTFEFKTDESALADWGWALDDIVFATTRIVNGSRVITSTFTAPEEARPSDWIKAGWTLITTLPAAPPVDSPPAWDVVNTVSGDGRTHDVWRFIPAPRVDARLVTPAIDLTEVGGVDAFLRLEHAYDLNYEDDPEFEVPRKETPFQAQHYQGGVVEVARFNRTRGTWDDWEQLWADPGGPSRASIKRPITGVEESAGPYTHTLADAGDTFTRYPRTYDRYMKGYTATTSYYYPIAANISYAFSGTSGSPGARDVADLFDLSAFTGDVVRFGFHGFSTPNDDDFASRHWTLGRVEVVGRVLSTDDARLRFRVGTDGSVLAGSWAIDEFEVTGTRYTKSVGVHLTQAPTFAAADGAFDPTFKGFVKNYGPLARSRVAVGIRTEDGSTWLEPPRIQDGGTVTGVSGYDAVIGPFDLAAAGEPGSTRSFQFQLTPRDAGSRYPVRVEILEGSASVDGITYTIPRDDVPGRASRRHVLDVADVRDVTLEGVTLDPVALDSAGVVGGSARIRNAGTLPVLVQVSRTWTTIAGDPLGQSTSAAVELTPGTSREFSLAPILLPAPGDHVVTVRVLRDGVEDGTFTQFYRVGTSGVALASSFESGLEEWSMSGTFAEWARDEAAFGSRSVLLGVNNTVRADRDASGTATLASPLVDLRAALPDAALTFWQKRVFGATGHVEVQGRVKDCADWVTLTPAPALSLSGSGAGWEMVRIPLRDQACSLGPLIGSVSEFRFVATLDGDGWRVDGVAIASGIAPLSPATLKFPIVDSARKVFPFMFTNGDVADTAISAFADPILSRATAAQRKWFTTSVPRPVLPPSTNGSAELVVETPAARGAFPQSLYAAISVAPRDAPFATSSSGVALDFRPRPRADIAVSARIDGDALSGQRLGVEEAIPHEIVITATNQGTESSAPMRVIAKLVFDDTGDVVWELEENLRALVPYATDESSFAVFGDSWRPGFGQRGNYTLRVVADPDRLHVDYDRANDDIRLPMAVTRLVRPDLMVPRETFILTTGDGRPMSEAVPGEIVRVAARVSNGGIAPAHAIIVRVIAGSSILKEELVPVLAPGESYVIRANQLVPGETIVYRVLAFSPDLEIDSSNNEQAVELAVYPPEIAIERPGRVDLDPAKVLTVPLNVTNTGPFPLVLDAVIKDGENIARVTPERSTLGPSESREIVITLDARNARAGPRPVILRLSDASGVAAERTIHMDVLARPAMEVVTYSARGTPTSSNISLDVLNTGNVPIHPTITVEDAAGNVLGREHRGEVGFGSTMGVVLTARLPEETPPGPRAVNLVTEAPGIARTVTPITIDVLPSRRVFTRVDSSTMTEREAVFATTVRLDGNEAALLEPRALGLPPGARVAFEPARLALAPGESANVRAAITLPASTLTGLHVAELAFARVGEGILEAGNAVSLPLDLRRAVLRLDDVTRTPSGSVAAGEVVSFVARVRNAGERDATDVPVELYVDGVLTSVSRVTGLEPGRAGTVEFRWKTQPGEHIMTFVVDAHGPHARDAEALARLVDVTPSLASRVASATDTPPVSVVLALVGALFAARVMRRGERRRDE